MMGVQKLRNADVVFSDDAANARQGQLQLVGCGSDRKEDSVLDGARVHWFERKRKRDRGGFGQVGFQIHLQEF